MLDLHRLRYFVAVMDCGSISAASKRVNAAQPALSYHMSELERLTGLKLFDRLPRGISPTLDGLFLLEHARSLLQAVDHVEQAISARSHRSVQARVRLGMIPSLAATYAPEIIAAWSRAFPQSELHVFEARTADCSRMLAQSELDIAIHVGTGKEDASCVLFTEKLYLISGKPLPQAIGNAMPLEALSGIDLILPAKSNPIRVVIDKAFRARRINPNILMEIDGQDTVKRAVEEGIAASIMSWNGVRKECNSNMLLAYAITEPDIHRSIVLSTASQFDQRLVGQLKDIMRNIVNVDRE